jgi:hypothetical protein
MAQICERLGFLIEAVDRLSVVFGEDLNRYEIACFAIVALEDGSHAACAGEPFEDEPIANDVSLLHIRQNAGVE